MSLIRIIYQSENTMNMAGTRMLVHFNDIVSKARIHNSTHGICGFLMFDRKCFHQILEGERKETDAVFARISVDQRHGKVKLLKHEEIKAQTFKEWSMGSFLNDTAIHPLQIKHGLQCCTAIKAEQFVDFARDFLETTGHDPAT